MITWLDCFVLTAAALVAVVWTLKRKFTKNDVNALRHKTPEETPCLTSLSSHSETNDSSEFSSCIETERCSTDRGQDGTSNDSSLGKSDKEIIKDVTVCSGYGSSSTGDKAQKNTDKSESDSGVTNGDLNTDSSITDDSFKNTAVTKSRVEESSSSEDEGNESETEGNRKTYFTDRKHRLAARMPRDDFESELQSHTEVADGIWDRRSRPSEPDGYKSKNDSVDTWENTETTAERDTQTVFDEKSSATTGTQLDSRGVSSTDTAQYWSEGSEPRCYRYSECRSSSDSGGGACLGFSLETSLSTIYPDDSSSSADDVQFVEHQSDISSINTTTPEYLNEAFIDNEICFANVSKF